jgi:outer membrane receptor protein involved in Fe transport
VLVDGLRLRDAAGERGDAIGILQDLVVTDIGRVEVLRGAGSSLYGTDAIGGVVNIVTDEGGGRTRGSVSLDGGSLDSLRAMARMAGGLRQDRIQYSFGVTHWNVMSGIEGNSPARNTSGQGQVTFHVARNALLSARIYEGDSFGFLRVSPQPAGTLPAAGIINAVVLADSQLRRYEAGTPVSQLALGPATFIPDAFDPDSTRAGRFFTGAFRFTIRPTEQLGLTAQYQHVSSRRDYGDGPAGPGFQPEGSSLSTYRGNIDTAVTRIDASLGRFQQINAGYEFEREDFVNRVLPPPPTSNFFGDISQRSHAIFAQDQLRLLDGRLQISGAYRGAIFGSRQASF